MPRYLVRLYSGVSVGVFVGWDQRLNGRTEWSRLSAPVWMGLVQSAEGLNKTKRLTLPPVRGNSSCLSAWSATLVFSCVQTRTEASVSLGPKPASFQTGPYTIGSDWTTPSALLLSLQLAKWRLLKSSTNGDQTWNFLSRQTCVVTLAKLNVAYSANQVKLNLGHFLLMPLKIINKT